MFDKVEKFLVPFWGTLWITGVTCVSVGVIIWSIKWILSLLGVL